MEDVQSSNAGEVKEDSGGAVESGSVDSNAAEGSSQSANTQGTAETGDTNSPPESGEQAEEFVKDEEGNEYIPRKAFEERIKKLAAQKNDAKSTFLESLRNDPAALAEFKKAIGIESQDAEPKSSPQTPTETKFQKFLAPLSPQLQAHYMGFVESIAEQFEDYVSSELDKRINPILSHIGESKVNSFKQMTSDYDRYAPKIRELLETGAVKSLEDAYKLASYEDKIKGAVSAKPKPPVQKHPINRGQGVPQSATQRSNPKSLREAIEMAYDKKFGA